jgi:hypothetical protein
MESTLSTCLIPQTQNPKYVIYTNVYTLEGKDPSTNKYVDMYLLWLANIYKYANFQKDDLCVTFIDEETYRCLNVTVSEKYNTFQSIKGKLKIAFIKYPVPKTHKQGMLQKYSVNTMLEYTEDKHAAENPVYMYLDVDVLIVNDIRKLDVSHKTSPDKTSLFLSTEFSTIDHPNYYGALITDEEKEFLKSNNINLPGFSAGVFGWQNNKHIRELFEYVLYRAHESKQDFYTIEQPFFHAGLFQYMFRDIKKFLFKIMNPDEIGHNTIGAHKSSVMVLSNYCGEPANESVHWAKMYHQLLTQFVYN